MISRRIWYVSILLVLVYVLGIASNVAPWLRGPEEWRWPLADAIYWERLWPFAGGWLLTLGWVLVIDRSLNSSSKPRRLVVIGLAGLMVASIVVQLAALRMERADVVEALFWRSTDYYANGYFTVGAGIGDVNEFLSQYPQLMASFPAHPQVHPPGLPIIYWVTGQALSIVPGATAQIASTLRQMDCNNFLIAALPNQPLSSAVAGMVGPVLANALVVLCTFQIARVRFGHRVGLLAAAFWVMVPSAVIFAGSWSQLYPVLACLTWLSLDAGLQRRQLRWLALAGAILSVSTVMELGTAALALFMVVYIVARYAVERRNPLHDWKFLIAGLVVGVSGTLCMWIAYRLIYGVSLNDIVAAMWPVHTGYQFDRLTWLLNHPYEFAVFVGLPLMVLASSAWWRSIRQWRAGQTADPLTLSMLISLGLLSLIDPARDETARTWMIFMPLVVVTAAQWFSERAYRRRQLVSILLLLGIQVAAMLLFMRFMALTAAPEVDVRAVSAPGDMLADSVEFEGGLILQGYRVSQVAPDQWQADLYWQPRTTVAYPYSVFAHMIDRQGQLIGQQDTWPEPYMTCWAPGSVYLDRHVITLSPASSPDPVQLTVGVYNADTGQRLEIKNNDQSSDRVILDLPTQP